MNEEEQIVTLAEVRIIWSDSAVKCLLDFYSANMNDVGRTFALKSKTKLWQKGAEVLATEGFQFTPIQIETKFRSLERQYKKRLLNNKLTGRNRMTCPYEKELDEIFRQKKGVYPEYVLGTEAMDVGDATSDLLQNPTSPIESSRAHSVSQVLQDDTPKRKKSSAQEKAISVLEQMAEDRRKEHKELMALLKQKEENRERRANERQQLLLSLIKKD